MILSKQCNATLKTDCLPVGPLTEAVWLGAAPHAFLLTATSDGAVQHEAVITRKHDLSAVRVVHARVASHLAAVRWLSQVLALHSL